MKIVGREELRKLTQSSPKTHKAIIIHEYNHPEDVSDIAKNCKEFLLLSMDDITSDRLGGPTKQQIKEIMEVDKYDDYDFVACKQGISRSSAIAYLIECLSEEPDEAIKILDHTKHFPNELILKHGLDIWTEIGAEESFIDDFKKVTTDFYNRMAEHRGWKRHPHNLVSKYFK